LTSDGVSEAPIWTPDGQRVTFSVSKSGRRELYWQLVDGTAAAEPLVADTNSVWPGSWSPDGSSLIFTRQPPTDQNDIGLFDLKSRHSTMVVAGGPAESYPRISPDGRWLAYASWETGRPEIVVGLLETPTIKRQISSDGGIAPVWSSDGKVLYYRFGQDYLAADVSRLPAIGKSTTIAKGVPPASGIGFGHPGYDVGLDGRLLIVQPADEEMASPGFEIVLNWFEELKQRVPVGK
jgi:Tol biopolymer transport system component